MRVLLCVWLVMCSDEKDGVWVWNYNGNDMYYDVNTKVRLRVREVVFQNQDEAALQRRKQSDAHEHDACNSTIVVKTEQTAAADGQTARPYENGTTTGHMDCDGANHQHERKADDACTTFGGVSSGANSSSFLVGVSANFAPMMVVVRIHIHTHICPSRAESRDHNCDTFMREDHTSVYLSQPEAFVLCCSPLLI